MGVFSVENSARNASAAVTDILVPAGYRFVSVIGTDEIYAKHELCKK
jgi:hypothetical protein